MWKNLQRDLNLKSNLLSTFCLFAAALGLSLQKIVIPQYKFRGETAVLECDYQLNGKRDSDDDMENTNFNYRDNDRDVETLYSVKWYKDGEEFYRFVPKSNPPQNSYKGNEAKAFGELGNFALNEGLFLRTVTMNQCSEIDNFVTFFMNKQLN